MYTFPDAHYGAANDGFRDTRYSTPDNEVLLNSVKATTREQLQKAEGAALTRLTAVVEGNKPMPGNFDAAHLKSIHKELLQDVYPWAGQTRAWGQFQGQKERPHGTLFYAPYEQIDTRLNQLSNQFQQENQLKGLSKEQFVDRLSYYADQYNYVHAFREGNGRTLQVVLAEMGRGAGYKVIIDEKLIPQYNPARDAAILRRQGPNPADNLAGLRKLLDQATKPAEGEQAEALRHPSLARPIPESSPAMRQAEALRTVIISSREIAEELVMQRLVKHNYAKDHDYLEQAKSQEAVIVSQAQRVQREPGTWPTFREHVLDQAKVVENAPNIERTTRAHLVALQAASAELDTNRSLTPAFRESELPAELFTKLGKPLDEMWKRGQMEKLLTGQRSDQLPLVVRDEQGQEKQTTMQLQVKRDEAGKATLQVYLPPALTQTVTQAVRSGPTPNAATKSQPEVKPENNLKGPADLKPKRKGPKL